MTISSVTDDLNARLVARLYDERGGHYLLMQLVHGQFVSVRPLTRDEALTWYCAKDQVLRHVYPPCPSMSHRRNVARQMRRRSGRRARGSP